VGGVSVTTFGLVLTLDVLEALFEGKKVVLLAKDVRFVLEIDPAELAMSKDMIEKAMLMHMHASPLVN
jgi:hypothetical protein